MQRLSSRTVPLNENLAEQSRSSGGTEHEDVGAPVRHAVSRLSSAHREVVYLRYYSCLSHDQIAGALGITTQAVHGRLQRARRELSRELSRIDREQEMSRQSGQRGAT